MAKKTKKGAAAKASTKTKKTPPAAFEGAIAASAEVEAAKLDTREPVIRRKFKEKLPVACEPVKLQAMGDELAGVINQRLGLKEERRAAMAIFKEKIGALDERERELAANIAQHSEPQMVDCVERLTVTNEVEVVRLDTGAVISTRAATGGELQDPLFGIEEEDEMWPDDDDHQEVLGAPKSDAEPEPEGEHDVDATSFDFDQTEAASAP